MRLTIITLIVAVGLAGCDGPAQMAGKERDKAAAAAAGQAYTGNGPNERLGAAQDKVETAARHARDADRQALKRQGDAIKTQADIAAERLEDQAKAIRKQAGAQSDVLDQKAKSIVQ